MPSLSELMKQAKEVQEKIAKVQKGLESVTIEASSGGGMVKVTANGRGDILSISIEQEVVNPEEVQILEELILAAVNEAARRARDALAAEMNKLTGGIPIPGLS
ncbi:MAG: YbaB/EbfC family nucleoid-associated protein [Thermodesulfobacteriota bacterium]